MLRMIYRRACLEIRVQSAPVQYNRFQLCWRKGIPLGFMFSKDLPLGVIADDLDVDEASKVKLLRSKHRHLAFPCAKRCKVAWMARDDEVETAEFPASIDGASYGTRFRASQLCQPCCRYSCY